MLKPAALYLFSLLAAGTAFSIRPILRADAHRLRDEEPLVKPATHSKLVSLIHVDQTLYAENPLLETSVLPNLVGVRPEHMRPAVTSRLEDGAQQLNTLETFLKQKLTSKEPISYDDLVIPLESLYDHVSHPFDLLQHLKSVRDSAPLREAIEELDPKVMTFWQKVSQSKPIYQALEDLKASASFSDLSEARQRIVKKELLDRKLGGVGLQGKDAEEFNANQKQLSELSTNFSNNVLDARKAWNVTLSDKNAVRGIPERALEAAAAGARKAGRSEATAIDGPWVLSLDGTVYGPVLTYAENRSLRELMFRASATLASTGPTSNSRNIAEILRLRQRQADLLGYKSYADLSFASKMAKKEEVHKLLDDLQTKGKPAAIQDDSNLRKFARENHSIAHLDLWDRGFYIEKLRKAEYDIDAESLRVYFPFAAVTQGLFELATRLFDIQIKQDNELAPQVLWHKDVSLYTVSSSSKKLIGYILVDPYSRPAEKRAGGWMQGLVPRQHSRDNHTQTPVAVVVTNFPAPQGDKPALLSMGEVSTLFHEFGHALQHVLTKQTELSVSGINGVEWDAVEIASQFMEYWVDFDRVTLYSFAKHYKTQKPLPEATYQRLRRSQHFFAGSGLVSQIYLGKVDLRLHEQYAEGEDVNAIQKSIAKDVLVFEPLPESRPLCSFSHIFAGGYAAGYYSYQWSKVLSADAFSAFDEAGLSDPQRQRALGKRLASTLLGVGGGRDPAKVFADFRGRGPSEDALLKYDGLL